MKIEIHDSKTLVLSEETEADRDALERWIKHWLRGSGAIELWRNADSDAAGSIATTFRRKPDGQPDTVNTTSTIRDAWRVAQ